MRHCYVLRVFTRGDEGGNHLGVVPDSTGLDTQTMQVIAAELGFSETVFLDWRHMEGAPTARIFTRTTELPFSGHPLVGACWVLSKLGPGADHVLCGVGEVALSMEDDVAWIETDLDQRIETLNDPIRTAVLRGFPPAKMARRVMMPFPYLLLELDHPEDVSAAQPNVDAFDPNEMVFICAWESDRSMKARFFAPEFGVTEDPATGSAAVALAAVLQARGQPEGRLDIHQGDEVGSPSTILLRWGKGRARIGGTVRKDEVRVLGY